MSKTSKKDNKSIYQIVREELNLSRADATTYIPGNAEFPGMDGVNESRLVKLEHGDTAVQPEDVVAMAKRYNMPELRNYYCRHQCAIGKIDVHEVKYKDSIHEILVNIAVLLENLGREKIRLMEILEDGQVDKEEKDDYKRIYKELEAVSMTIESLQLWCEKNRTL